MRKMHVQPKQFSEYPFYLRWIYRSLEKKYGQILLPWLFWGRMPFLQILFFLFWSHLDRKKSILEPSLRALVQLRVAQINWCSFCVDLNSFNLMQRTHSKEKIDYLHDWKNRPIFSAVEKVALEYTEEISKAGVKIHDELIGRLKEHFTDDQIVELTALISFQTMSAKFNAALDIPTQGVCKISTKKD